tara:strand:- start:311 stop:625 length:315 start_codon:yes stop_codon:yes gene_type:complete
MAINRYEFNKQHAYTNKGRCLNTTKLPIIEKSYKDRYIISKESDRLDLLSYEFYGDSRYWFILANANNLGKGTLDVPAGKQIRIPPNSIITELREIIQKSEENR